MKTMVKTLTVLLVTTFVFAETVTIQNSTVVAVKTRSQLSTAQLSLGQEVILTVAQDVVEPRTGVVVIKAGAPVYGTVQEVKGSQMAGIAGKIVVSINSTVAVDGTNIALTGSFSNAAKSQVGATVAVSVILCPLALLNKGNDGIIPVGAQQRAMTIGTFEVEVD